MVASLSSASLCRPVLFAAGDPGRSADHQGYRIDRHRTAVLCGAESAGGDSLARAQDRPASPGDYRGSGSPPRDVSIRVGHEALSTASLLGCTVIALYAVFGALRFALRSSTVTSEHLYAALSAYLLTGVFLGVLYWTLEEAWPGTVALSGPAASQPFHMAEGIYFSFITLATVGYGDMVPGNDMVRGLAIVEAIAGQFYLAVMIARLMSLYMREAR